MAEPVDRRANPIFAPADQVPSLVTPGDPVQGEVIEEDRSMDRVEEIRSKLFLSTKPDTSWDRAEEIKQAALTSDATEQAVGDSLPAELPYQTSVDQVDPTEY